MLSGAMTWMMASGGGQVQTFQTFEIRLWRPSHEARWNDVENARCSVDVEKWARPTLGMANFAWVSLAFLTFGSTGCGQCQGVSGFNDTMPTWSGLQQAFSPQLSLPFVAVFSLCKTWAMSIFVEVKYGNGKLCKADKDPLDVPQCSLALGQHPPSASKPTLMCLLLNKCTTQKGWILFLSGMLTAVDWYAWDFWLCLTWYYSNWWQMI